MEPFRDKLLQTKLPFIRAKSQPARNTKLWESKVGGTPYLPKGIDWPCAPLATLTAPCKVLALLTDLVHTWRR